MVLLALLVLVRLGSHEPRSRRAVCPDCPRPPQEVFLRLFEQAWALQTMQGGFVHAENPTGSLAWKELNLGLAYEVDIHMCSVGLKCAETGIPVLGHRQHVHLEGKRRTQHAETYPQLLLGICAAGTPASPGHARSARRRRRGTTCGTPQVFSHDSEVAREYRARLGSSDA